MEKGFGREAVQFTVKGPIPIKGDDDVNLSGVKALDITLAQPSTIGELVFKNYYTATVAVLVLYDTKGKSRSGRGSWSCSVAQKVLMPNPHLEPGSHDTFSITPSDSLVSWNDVSMIRLILRQPSPLWLTFKIEEVNLYSDLPRMGGTEGWTPEEMDPERMLLSLLRRQTLAALSWSPGPDSNPSTAAASPLPNKYELMPTGYEIHKLPSN